MDASGAARRVIVVRRWPLAIVAGLLLAGCATVPSAPGVMALPGSAKSLDEFRSDDAACRQAAEIDAQATKQWRYDMVYLQCMYAKGNQIPGAAPRRARYAPPPPPPPPAAAPPAPAAPPASQSVPPPPAGTPPPPPPDAR
jgi:hypothetical protein